MLFHLSWENIDTTEEGSRRSQEIFQSWQPPAGAEFIGIYGYADNSGGVAIIEVDTAATLARTTAPWTPWLRFTATPLIPLDESKAIEAEATGFLDSVG